MIKVTVELDKGGRGKDVIVLGSVTLANQSSVGRTRRDYNVTQHRIDDGVYRTARIEAWPSNEKSVWKLVKKALEALGH